MAKKNKQSNLMRIIHRYLGFFLAGIMAVYALSGVLLIFRDTQFLKQEKNIVKTVAPNLSGEDLGKELHLRKFKAEHEEGDVLFSLKKEPTIKKQEQLNILQRVYHLL